MARTNTRTQMILGMLLNCARVDIENIDSMHPYMVQDQDYEQLQKDADYQKAQDLFQSIILREIAKNQGRIFGSDVFTIADIDQETGHEGEEE